jgi:nicotinamidase-related amidase
MPNVGLVTVGHGLFAPFLIRYPDSPWRRARRPRDRLGLSASNRTFEPGTALKGYSVDIWHERRSEGLTVTDLAADRRYAARRGAGSPRYDRDLACRSYGQEGVEVVMPLLERADSVLIVIDAQPGFSGGDLDAGRAAAASRDVAGWLAGVAAALAVPIVVTEEDATTNGPTDPVIGRWLPPGTPVLPKPVFGLVDVPDILEAIESTGRRTAVLVGAETDVCVAQSAVGLVDLGFRVVVVADATFSPGVMHEHGLRHVRDAGAELRHAKGVYYEWIRTLDAARTFERDHPELSSPPGFSL